MDARRRRQGRSPREAPGADGLGLADAGPGVFEAVTRQMVEALSEELRGIRHRVDNLLWMVAGAVLLDTALRVVGT